MPAAFTTSCAVVHDWQTSVLPAPELVRSMDNSLLEEFLEPRDADVHDHRKSGEHDHRNPDQRDLVSLASVEDGAAEAILGRDELADNGACERQPDVDPQD